MKLWKKLALALSVVAMALTGGLTASAQRSLDEIKESGQLVMATSADFPPFEWVIMEDGASKIVGIDVDVAQLIADELGVDLVIDDTSFDALIQTVNSHKADVVLAGMTYTEERAEQVEFSDVYYVTQSYFLVPLGKEADYTSVEDFADLKIGVQKGTIQESMLQDILPDTELQSMNKNGDLIQALITGRVDAVVMDGIVVEEFVNQNSDKIALVEDLQLEEDEEGFAVVAAKGNTDLIDLINSVIADLSESGELVEIIERNASLNTGESE